MTDVDVRPGTGPGRRDGQEAGQGAGRAAGQAVRDLAVVAATTVLAGAVWLLLTRGFDLALTAPVGGEVREVALGGVLVASVLAGLAGALLLRVLEARLRHGPRHALRLWTWTACVVLLASFAGPAGATTTGAVVGLWTLHLVVALGVVGGLRLVRRA